MSEEAELDWQRLHPVTVIREFLALAWNFLLALVFAGAISGFGGLIETIAPLTIVLLGVARYLFTAYAITDDAVHFRRGVFIRQRTELPRARIQNVSIGADVVARLFSMQTVNISSAGSEGEIELAVVSRPVAAELMRELTSDEVHVADSTAAGAAENGTAVADMPWPAISPTRPPTEPPRPFPTSGPVEVGPQPVSRVERYRLLNRPFLLFVATSVPPAGALLAALVVAAVLTVVDPSAVPFVAAIGLLSVIVVPVLGALELFGFHLEVEPERLRVGHGLLSTRERWARKERVQLVEVRRPWLRRRFGYETLAVATADVTDGDGSRFDLCAPMIHVGSWTDFLADVGDEPDPHDPDEPLRETRMASVSRRSIRRRTLRSSIPGVLLVIVLVGLIVASGSSESGVDTRGLEWWAPFLLLPVIGAGSLALARRSYRVDGWSRSGHHLLVRRGRFDETVRLLRTAKIQSVQVESSLFQQRLGLATLVVDTANVGPPTQVPDMMRADAERLASDLVSLAAEVSLPDGV